MGFNGSKVINGSGGVRQGITSLQANTWHHLVVSYPGAASVLMQPGSMLMVVGWMHLFLLWMESY